MGEPMDRYVKSCEITMDRVTAMRHAREFSGDILGDNKLGFDVAFPDKLRAFGFLVKVGRAVGVKTISSATDEKPSIAFAVITADGEW